MYSTSIQVNVLTNNLNRVTIDVSPHLVLSFVSTTVTTGTRLKTGTEKDQHTGTRYTIPCGLK